MLLLIYFNNFSRKVNFLVRKKSKFTQYLNYYLQVYVLFVVRYMYVHGKPFKHREAGVYDLCLLLSGTNVQSCVERWTPSWTNTRSLRN